MNRTLAAVAALGALVTSQVAAAATPSSCISEREISQLAIYAVPSLVEGVRAKCGRTLSAKGFLATRGDAFASRYAELQDETWPVAKSAITKFATSKTKPKDADSFAMLAGLPDDAVRPLVDALIAQKIGEEIKPKDCGNIERGLQLVSPLGPRDSGALLGFIFTLVKPDDAAVCPA
jgi:hypothetical protein